MTLDQLMLITLERIMIVLQKFYMFLIYDFRRNLESAQPIKVVLNFSENVPAGVYGYFVVLTNKLINERSDGQHHFDLV